MADRIDIAETAVADYVRARHNEFVRTEDPSLAIFADDAYDEIDLEKYMECTTHTYIIGTSKSLIVFTSGQLGKVDQNIYEVVQRQDEVWVNHYEHSKVVDIIYNTRDLI